VCVCVHVCMCVCLGVGESEFAEAIGALGAEDLDHGLGAEHLSRPWSMIA
jgi:hypothetical protein